LRTIEGIQSITPSIEQYVLTSVGDRKAPAIVRGVAPENLSTLPFIEKRGIDPLANGYGAGNNGGNTVLMGLFLALGREGLNLQEGDTFDITTDSATASAIGAVPRRKTYRVGNIVETGSVELDRLYIFMPMQQAQILFNKKGRYDRLDMRLTDPYDVAETKRKILDATGYSLSLGDWMADRKEYLNALQIERTMVRLLVMVIMAIATLNIIVGVVMLVKNKSRDIAILRTIGLSRGAVTRVFMMVGTVLGSLGALLGVAVGVLFVINIGAIESFINLFVGGDVFDAETYGLSKLPAILDWAEVGRTALYAILMSALVSIIPARWAARQEPVDALRFE
jgi:lipoprotein-releasing system permease protein